MLTRATVLTLVFGLAAASTAHAQSRLTAADLRGTIRDQTAAAVPGATVTATAVDTNTTRTAVSDTSGRYFIGALPPGAYKITAEMRGFAPQRREGVTLHLGQSLELDFALPVGGRGERVT
jgi:hypothetical protein